MSETVIMVYGHPATRVNRPLWLLRELGLPYKIDSKTHFHSDEFPGAMKKQPALMDTDGTVIFESLAINLYLIRKYGESHALAPLTPPEQARTYQWTMFAMTELDPRLFELLFHLPAVEKARHPLANDDSYAAYFGRQRSVNRRKRLQAELVFPLHVLESEFATSAQPYLLGDRFTVADLNLAAVMEWATFAGITLETCTASWLQRCMVRPKSSRMFQEPNTPSLASLGNAASFSKRYGDIGFVDVAEQARL